MIIVNSREDFLLELKKYLSEEIVFVEIGVLNGDFSKMILDIINPKKLILIDPYETNDIHYKGELTFPTAYSTMVDYSNLLIRFKTEIESKKVVVDKRYSYEAVIDYENESCDVVYLDGSHVYEDVKIDLNDWYPKVKTNGIIALHDYIDFGSFGVIKAVDEFLKEKDLDVLIYNKNGGDISIIKA